MPDCTDATPCTVDACDDTLAVGGSCGGADNGVCCTTTNELDGTDCSAELPPLASCTGGVCGSNSCTSDPPCADMPSGYSYDGCDADPDLITARGGAFDELTGTYDGTYGMPARFKYGGVLRLNSRWAAASAFTPSTGPMTAVTLSVVTSSSITPSIPPSL